MPVEPIVVVLVLILGCAAFILWVMYCAFWAVGKAGGGVARMLGLGPKRRADAAAVGPASVCSNDRCQKVERRRGRYCSQCGSPLQPYQHSVDVSS